MSFVSPRWRAMAPGSTPSQDFPEGLNTLQAQTSDSQGRLSPLGPVYSLLTDYTPPPISLAGPNGTSDTPTVSGTSEPGATVVVTLDGGTPLCTAVTGANGQWSCIATAPITDGTHTVSAVATDAAGNASQVLTSAAFKISGNASSGGSGGGSIDTRLAGGGIRACNATGAPLTRESIGDFLLFGLAVFALKRRLARACLVDETAHRLLAHIVKGERFLFARAVRRRFSAGESARARSE